MTIEKLKKTFLDNVYLSNTNINKTLLKKELENLTKSLLELYVPKTRWEKTRDSKNFWKSEAVKQKSRNAELAECQRILGVVGKLK